MCLPTPFPFSINLKFLVSLVVYKNPTYIHTFYKYVEDIFYKCNVPFSSLFSTHKHDHLIHKYGLRVQNVGFCVGYTLQVM